jgi:hypothetical protein
MNISEDTGVLVDGDGNVLGSVITEFNDDVYIRSVNNILTVISLADSAYNPIAVIPDSRKPLFYQYDQGRTAITSDYDVYFEAFGFFMKEWYPGKNGITYKVTYLDKETNPAYFEGRGMVPYAYAENDAVKNNSHNLVSTHNELLIDSVYTYAPLTGEYSDTNITADVASLSERSGYPLIFNGPVKIIDGFDDEKAKNFRSEQFKNQ